MTVNSEIKMTSALNNYFKLIHRFELVKLTYTTKEK